ncbi:MAG: PAS domain S-box protein [Magnetococcales bacterium]|nr:PAS domain S-box protein [Magnetococcales bacterium]
MHGFPGSTFLGWSGDERNQAIHTINILADMQKTRILHMFKELRTDAGFLAQDRFMKETLNEELLPKPSDPPEAISSSTFHDAHGPYLETWLREFQSDAPFYQDIHILHMQTGQIIASTNPRMLHQVLLTPEFIERVKTTRQDYIGGFTPIPAPKTFFVGCPMFLTREDPLALVVLEISLQSFLQPIHAFTKGPWRTSVETILVDERGLNLFHPDETRNVNEQDFLDNDNISLLPSKIAANGQEGFIETQDQHNISVLAGYRHIRLFSEWSWGLVIQMGRDDLMQPMSTAFGFAWFIGCMATGAFILVAFILTRRLTRPLRQLTEAAHQLTAGHRHVRSQHSGTDEVGVLAKAFDTMAEEVTRTLDHLERTVAHRTIALARELDIRKQQQQAQQVIETSLKESEHRYRSLVDTMTAGVAVYEAVEGGNDFVIRDINRMGEHLTRLEKQAIIGSRVTEVFPGIFEFGLLTVFQHVYRTSLPASHPVALYSDQRLEQWFENRVYKLPSGEIVAIFDDISERKLAEDALKLVQFSVDNTHDAMLWFTQTGRILRTNRAASEMLGYSQEELLTLSASDLHEEMTREAWNQSWREIQQTGTRIYMANLRRRDRSQFPVEISASYLQGEHTKPDHLFISVRDITERIRGEKEKQTLEQMAFHRERLATIGTLAAGVAHEINNPNNAILFNAVMLQGFWPDLELLLRQAMDEHGDFLLADLPASESLITLPRLFEGIRKSSERIQSIIGNLKHLSRQNPTPISKPVEINTVLRETTVILQGQITRHTDHFHMQLLDQPVMVPGNSQQLEQVFINLVLNALQSLPNRNHAVRVSMVREPDSSKVQVIISDEGIGIPEEHMGQLTNPFFTTKLEQDGTGLGLSIANSIIVNHSGQLSFESREQRGTIVTVTLPTIVMQKRGDHP